MRAKTVNEALSAEKKRERVMKILKDRDIPVPHDSYLKFYDLSLTDLTPEQIVKKLISESVNFERGKDPKKTMGIGYSNPEEYVKFKLTEMFPSEKIEKLEDSFWTMFNESFHDWKSYEVAETIVDLLKNTPIKYQMEYMDGDIEVFQEGVEEGWIKI